MRFAGTRMEGFLNSDRPDYGNMARNALEIRNKESTTATDLMGKTAATGIAEAGRVEAANITGAAASCQGKRTRQCSNHGWHRRYRRFVYWSRY